MPKKTKVIESVKLSRYEISMIAKWLDYPLHSQDARDRNTFFKLVSQTLQDSESFRLDVLSKNSVTNPDGSPVIEEGVYKLKVENEVEVKANLNAFLETEAPCDISKQVYKSVHRILGKTMKSFTIEEGAMYDQVMSKLESM